MEDPARVSAAGVGGAVAGGHGEAGEWCSAASLTRLREKGVLGALCGGHPVALYYVAGTLHATDSLCTHAFIPLEDGVLDGYEIECPVHQARFDVRSGACVRFPAKRALRVFPVRCRDGMVEVWIEAGLELAKGVQRAAPAFVAGSAGRE